MSHPTPTLDLLLDLAARLRLACEALSGGAGAAIEPRDIRIDDLAPDERARLRRAARDDLWGLINEAGGQRAAPEEAREPLRANLAERIAAGRLAIARRGNAGAA